MPRIERIGFLGTPEFALPSLEALLRAGRGPRLVVSRPARPAGRGRILTDPPVVVRARQAGCPVLQPRSVRDETFREAWRAEKLDLGIVVAYGAILPREILEAPRWGCWNLHASLLPRWRGAAPVAAAIAAGDEVTGVTLQKMVEALDAGPILGVKEEPILAGDTAGELEARLSRLGAELLIERLEAFEREPFEGTAQPEEGITWAPRIDGPWTIDWDWDAEGIDRMARSRLPRPGVRVAVRGELLSVESVRLGEREQGRERPSSAGRWLRVDSRGACAIVAGDGREIWLERLKRPGRREAPAAEVFRGMRLEMGSLLFPEVSQREVPA